MSTDFLAAAEVVGPPTALEQRMARTTRVLSAIRRDGGTIEDVLRVVQDGSDGGEAMPEATLAEVARIYRHHRAERREILHESQEEAREIELERLEQLERTWRPLAAPRSGPDAPPPDPKAAEILLKIGARRDAILGLKAAEQHEHRVSGTVGLGAIGDLAEIARERDAAIEAGFQPRVIDGTAVEA